ncbi:universal stress protein [Puia sp. P3]|uniref:universal stress protein n=1 Tax=Puia sp. P3 TaxID=3423952 RepID=UPI003D664404
MVEVLNLSSVLESMVKTLDPVYEYPLDRNVAHAITEFVSTHHIDMLAMIPHRHSLFDKLFHPSVTKGVILKTKIPLLILPDIKPKH